MFVKTWLWAINASSKPRHGTQGTHMLCHWHMYSNAL